MLDRSVHCAESYIIIHCRFSSHLIFYSLKQLLNATAYKSHTHIHTIKYSGYIKITRYAWFVKSYQYKFVYSILMIKCRSPRLLVFGIRKFIVVSGS